MSAKKNYQALAAKRIKRPSEATNRLPRLGVYARDKVGKTTFCLSAPECLLIDPEDGVRQYTKSDPPAWQVREWTDLDDVYHYLKEGKHPYKWASLDGVNKMYGMALKHAQKLGEERDLTRIPGMVQLKDRGNANEMFKTMLQMFDTLNIGLIYTLHERVITVDESGDTVFDDDDVETASTRIVPDLSDGARIALTSIVDVMGRLYVVKATQRYRVKGSDEIKEREVAQRRLWLAKHPAYDTGARSEYALPDFVKNPTVPGIVNLISTGKVK